LVWLDFEGGDYVRIGLEPVELMRPFSAESISDRLAGQTDYIIDLVLAHMRQDYAGLNVTLVDSRHSTEPTDVHSSLFFGNYSAAYLGLADNVDTGNAALQQEAIIYSEDLALWESLRPSAEEVALALANIASHELGHLLGLEHSAEAGCVMATAGSARQVLEVDSAFQRSRLQSDVFPVGYQNSPVLLTQNVGVSSGSSSKEILRDLLHTPPPSFRDELGIDIPIIQCGSCPSGGCGHDHGHE
jgi:hypothetical protein